MQRTQRLPASVAEVQFGWSEAEEIAERFERRMARERAKRKAERQERLALRRFSWDA